MVQILYGLILTVIAGQVATNVWDEARNNEATQKAESKNRNGNADALFEGDIKLRQDDMAILNGDVQYDPTTDTRRKWPTKTVPYVLAGNLNSKARSAVAAAVQEYNQKTCIRFVQRSNQRDYIYMFPDGGCYSSVGKVGGRQRLSLGRGCEYKSIAVHEMLHALGFWHEQSRPDRDQYVRIIRSNIQRGMEYNFDKQRSISYNHPYDYDSVMHYGKTAFGRGRQTIMALKGDRNRNFGQPINGGLSPIDVKQVNAHYCAGTNPETTKKPVTTGDKYSCCPMMKSQCSNSWVKTNCAKSCGATPPKCEDKNRNCPRWKWYCGRNRYVIANCKLSCGTC